MIAVLRMGILHGTMDINDYKPELFVALPVHVNVFEPIDIPTCPKIPVLVFEFKRRISEDICEYEFERIRE